jgi:hypothetical protein
MTSRIKTVIRALKEDKYTLENKVEVNKPIQEVFDTITSSKIWVSCYPETLAVGGVTNRPFKKGDLILEKFLIGGWFYCMFHYEVDEYNPPERVTFHGKLIIINDFFDRVLGPIFNNARGTFEYDIEAKSENVTLWTRKLHLHHTGGVVTKFFYNIALLVMVRSQKKGADLFVNFVKRFIKSDYEL